MHRWSQLFIPTLREAPSDAEVASHKLLLRAGYIRQLGAGIYSYLFLGNRSVNKIVAIIREEMDRIGQEMLLPTLHPRELWEASGRWSVMGDNMFRLHDRKGADLCLGMTHEEVVTDIARKELRSYKQLPQIWYQIQTKFRDEPRPKSGLLRVRQFLMKDAYSFDIDEAGLDLSYQKHDEAYRRIFTRCGLQFVAVEADSGAMGGSQSQEFMVYTEAGEDLIASSPSGYAANLEKATSILNPVEDLPPTGDGLPELVHTPGYKTIDEVGAFLGVSPAFQMKGLAIMAKLSDNPTDWLPTLVFIRGDHTLNEAKLLATIGAVEQTPMTAEQLELYLRVPAGYIGPVNVNQIVSQNWKREAAKTMLRAEDKNQGRVALVLDKALEGRVNLVAGANRAEYHLRNVTPMRDFRPTLVADVRNILEGELDPISQQPLRLGKAVEIGHIFKLGYKYTQLMNATVLNKDGKEVNPIMGSYGIGVERILTSAIETSAAKFAGDFKPETYIKGPNATAGFGVPYEETIPDVFALPAAIAPFEVVVTITNIKDLSLVAAGEQVAADLTAAGFDVLLDDRDERAGVKFKDADLIGIPYRINIGRGVAEQKIELVDRLRNQTTTLPLTEAATHLTHAMQS